MKARIAEMFVIGYNNLVALKQKEASQPLSATGHIYAGGALRLLPTRLLVYQISERRAS